MILIDFGQIAIGSIMVQIKETDDLDENLVRHIILNNLLFYRKQYNKVYGELILCCDNRRYWRREYFSNYKIGRKKERKKSSYNWPLLFDIINKIEAEIKENFPYKVINVDGAEADDVIGTLCREFPNTKTIIVSSDKDFIQLHSNNVQQYSPVAKKLISDDDIDPMVYLQEHIIRGDRSDSIPNILSSDDTFITEGKRQKPLRKTVVNELLEMMEKTDPLLLNNIAKCPKDVWVRNWQRNEVLINLNCIPDEIRERIMIEYNKKNTNNRYKLFNFFITKKLSGMLEEIQNF